MAAFALELADIMHEIYENIPAVEQAERLAKGKEQRLYDERKIARRRKLNRQTIKKEISYMFRLMNIKRNRSYYYLP